ncbi:sigma-54 interaction domain-containing protein [Alicyclobacillus sp. ALC3]|uniref:sigma-54 interaction domain-containing protein n=1 Tax=Alicyclobacillus sp. ALC3 TaxID=2796143 RepID=UPI0023793B8F|nr:sigma 54-interacting transcriptional regulator [Alicyclobacillus sp. ALC3]WDL95129.1 sigma 54-interacting transcriptional regulator [Alicyclobacillus sp. ALC3]
MPSKEVNEQWLTAILDTIDEGIHAVDIDGVTIFYNGAAARMDGLSAADVIGRHVLSVFPSLGQNTSTLLQVLRTGQSIHNQPQTYTNFLGVTVHTVNATLPIRVDGQVVGALEIAKDLTQVRRLSDQVLALQAEVLGGARKPRRRGQPDTTSHIASYTFSDILTRDPRMEDVKSRAARAARTASPILVYGETGTGKELLVQAIHNASPRREAPFLALNCAALPGTLLEGILFGTVRGSFTGSEDRPGMFELADGGSLFLDEIQSMPLELQAKLLRVLQEGEVMRVGDTRVRKLDVRVIAAMNQTPESAVDDGTLRRDLYYRVNVVRLDIPPLRARRGDMGLLTERFITKWNARFASEVTGITPRVAHLFAEYSWPGNVRELENAIEAAMNLVSFGDIDGDALPAHLRERLEADADADAFGATAFGAAAGGGGDGGDELRRAAAFGAAVAGGGGGLGRAAVGREWVPWLAETGLDALWTGLGDAAVGEKEGLAAQGLGGQGLNAAVPAWPSVQTAIERVIIERALIAVGGNVAQAAKKLGLPRQTLQYRMQQHGL